MLQNAYLLAKIGADTPDNERNYAENLPKLAATLRNRSLKMDPEFLDTDGEHQHDASVTMAVYSTRGGWVYLGSLLLFILPMFFNLHDA